MPAYAYIIMYSFTITLDTHFVRFIDLNCLTSDITSEYMFSLILQNGRVRLSYDFHTDSFDRACTAMSLGNPYILKNDKDYGLSDLNKKI